MLLDFLPHHHSLVFPDYNEFYRSNDGIYFYKRINRNADKVGVERKYLLYSGLVYSVSSLYNCSNHTMTTMSIDKINLENGKNETESNYDFVFKEIGALDDIVYKLVCR
jgi:hypothetical protein